MYNYVTSFMKTSPNHISCKIRLPLSHNGYVYVLTPLASITAKILLITFTKPNSVCCQSVVTVRMALECIVVAQDKQPMSCKFPDNMLVMLAIEWTTFRGILS